MSESHLSAEQLWEAADVPLEGDDYAHVQLCADCRLELENVKMARGLLLTEPPPPPPLSDNAARRIGDVLRKAAEQEARRRMWWHAWWPFNFSPTWVFAPAAAVLLAFVAYRVTLPLPELPSPGIAKAPELQPQQQGLPAPPLREAPKPVAPVVKKVFASVKSTRKAKVGNEAVKAAQQLSEGSTVSTAKDGVLSMQLPDGSSMRLASASQVQLAKLEEKEVTLDVDKGSLHVVARHDATRELRVRAGDVEVVDVGTRFTVSRQDADHTLVWVEEGEVQVNAHGNSMPVHAGQAVQYRDGKLQRQQWASADDVKRPAPVSPPPSKVAAADETPPIPAEGEKVPPPPAPVPAKLEPTKSDDTVSSLDEWSTPGNLKDAPVNVPPPMPAPEPPPAPAAVAQAPSAAPSSPEMSAPSEDEANVSFLNKLRSQMDKIKGVFKPPTRLQQANDISKLADARRCNDALAAADAWLADAVPRGESFNLRRSVLSSKLRCLQYQGRTGDAAAVQRELEKL
jgi:hypothetical protein